MYAAVLLYHSFASVNFKASLSRMYWIFQNEANVLDHPSPTTEMRFLNLYCMSVWLKFLHPSMSSHCPNMSLAFILVLAVGIYIILCLILHFYIA